MSIQNNSQPRPGPVVVVKDQQRLSELRTETGQLTAQIARVTKLKDQ